MIDINSLKIYRLSAPIQAEFLYIYAKKCKEALASGEAVDITTLQHMNFQDSLLKNGIMSGHDSLEQDLNALINVWENVI